MKEQIRQLMEDALAQSLAPFQEQLLEHSAALSAQRFLLEMVYANQFISDASGFSEFMDGLISRTRERATKSGPMQDELAIELQARIATHLERFGNAVDLRISQGVQR